MTTILLIAVAGSALGFKLVTVVEQASMKLQCAVAWAMIVVSIVTFSL